jgi:hypothetical protein
VLAGRVNIGSENAFPAEGTVGQRMVKATYPGEEVDEGE